MAPIANTYVIVIDQLTDERRAVVHELVKVKADDWWHNMPNVWIASGHDSAYWRDELFPVIAGTNASILVMRLPDYGDGRSWAFQGPNSTEKVKWLYETYLEHPQSTD